MKKLWTRGLAALCAMVLLLGLLPMGALAADAAHTVWIVGDSTVCEFTDAYYYPRYGYGTQIGNYLDGTYKVENLALSGRSSKSFLSEANYTTLKNGMKAGDALIIGFGHNDEKDEAARYTNPNGDWQTEGSFAKSLYDNYVKLAQEKDVEVILCTPIVRRVADATITGANAHITRDKTTGGISYPGGDYPAAIRKLGQDKNATVVDLTALTKELYETIGPDETLYLHAWTGKKPDSVDNTHLNIYGAKKVSWLFANALKEVSTSELGKHIDLTAGEPAKATDLVENPQYVEPNYDGNLAQSELWADYTCKNADDTDLTFKGTVFGDMGGASNIVKGESGQTLETDADGNMHIAALGGKGKIASGSDGIAMYYCKIPAGKAFTFSATATINGFGAGNAALVSQAAFGLMARDDMYIDTYDTSIKSDYVAAGSWANSTAACASYYRKSGALGGRGTLSADDALAIGKSYQLTISYNGDGYACTFGNSGTQTGGYDFQLTSVDPNYVYVGMFATRNADVTFSNISLTVEGGITPDKPGGETPDNPDDPPKPTVPVEVDGAVAGGGLETIFAEIADVTDADVTAVKWSGDATGELTGDDLKYLVRDVDGGVRIDIPGVKAGKYTLEVTAKDVVYTAEDIEVKAHDRSGFAHQTVDANSVCTPYTEGVGAYKDDGTLKDNAIVLYVTDANKNTVTMSVGDSSVTGIGKILNSGQATNNGVSKVLLEASRADKPVVVRIVGTVNQPQGVSPRRESTDAAHENGDNGGMCYMSYAKNITIEGIGPDATIQGWGLSFRGDATDANNDNYGKNFEVRNLSFRQVPEDCVEITGNGNSNGTIKEPVSHAWVHNCSFYVPHITNPAAVDKGDGDGAVDFKFGQYMTLSYNYFEDYHKTSLIGGDDKNQQYHVTWHHNYWKNCDQRIPLARQADIHYYNNLAEGQKTSAMSLRANVYIFSEYNTFVNCKNPVEDKGTGGVCKSYQDVFENCTEQNAAQVVADKTQTVTSANKYANFDTNPGSYVAQGKYLLDAEDRGQANIEKWGGVMKAAADMTTVKMTVPGTVEDPGDETVAVTGVTLNQTTASVEVDKTLDLTATVAPTDATDKSVSWSSSDPAVASVDANGKVTAKKAGSATITVTTTDGEKTASCVVTVTAADDSGSGGGNKRPSYSGSSSTVTKPDDTKTDDTKPDDTKPDDTKPDDTTPAAPVAETYSDVEANSWYTSGVQFVVDRKLFIGVSDHSFAPTMSMSRAMVMTVLARVDGKEPTAKAGEPWYSGAMAWAVETGISDGTNPEADVTLEQFATMLYRYAVDQKLADAVEVDLTDVPDADQVSDWAAQAITWAKAKGILQGDQTGKLNPQNNASRAQAAVIMERFVEKCVK